MGGAGKKHTAPAVILVLALLVLAGGVLAARWLDTRAGAYEAAVAAVDGFFESPPPAAFVNQSARPPAADGEEGPGEEEPADALAIYAAPEGFKILSYAQAWDAARLAGLYEELKRNRHGDEIYTLNQIVVRPEEDENAAATHQADIAREPVRLRFGALPPDFTLWLSRGVSNIVLYGGDTRTTVESMAHSLSHEYGHLYTYYYFFGDAAVSLKDNAYARMRDAEHHGLFYEQDDVDHYNENHHLYLVEAAAEDYVQLMGSPGTRHVADYIDVRQSMAGAREPAEEQLRLATNPHPQENMALPLAASVPGLAEYFYSFLGQAPPATQPEQPVRLTITSGSEGHDLVEGYRTFTHYDIGWNTPYTDAIYTLICYDGADRFASIPIKTVRPGQAATATIGTVARQSGEYVQFYYDGLDAGAKTFYIVSLLPDGTYYLSEPLAYQFG